MTYGFDRLAHGAVRGDFIAPPGADPGGTGIVCRDGARPALYRVVQVSEVSCGRIDGAFGIEIVERSLDADGSNGSRAQLSHAFIIAVFLFWIERRFLPEMAGQQL